MKKNSQEMIRAFIAIELPKEIHDSFQKVQDDLKASMPDVRWTKHGNVHLTLKFLGDVQISRIDPIKKAIGNIGGQFSPFMVSFTGIGGFPNLRKPRIVWVGLEKGTDKLVDMVKLIETAMNRLGFPREKRPFRPHLTIGRIRQLNDPEAMEKAFEQSKVGELGGFTVERISLIKSQLDPSGSVYTILDEAPLGESG